LKDFVDVLRSGLDAFSHCGGDVSNPWFIAARIAVDSFQIASDGEQIIQDFRSGNDYDAGSTTFTLLVKIGGLKLHGTGKRTGFINSRAVPTSWKCHATTYNTSDGCDCDCGAVDPDCATDPDNIFGCSKGFNATCSNSGVCVYEKTIPSKWRCDPAQYNSEDGCQCNCGAPDPDCKKKNQLTHNCPCGTMTCHNEAGNCVGKCDGITFVAKTSDSSALFFFSSLTLFGIFLSLL